MRGLLSTLRRHQGGIGRGKANGQRFLDSAIARAYNANDLSGHLTIVWVLIIRQCIFGQAYTIGKANAMDLTIKGAEYVATRIRIGDEVTFPRVGEKLVVLHFTMQNPLPKGQAARISTFDWTVVDSMNSNHTPEFGLAGREPGSDVLDLSLKQGQKADGYVFFKLPDNCSAARIIVKSHTDAGTPSAVYAGFAMKPLAAPFADSGDEIPARIGAVYPTGLFDMKVEKIEFASGDALGMQAGVRCALFTIWIRNKSTDDFGPASGGGFCYFLTDSAGGSLERQGGTLDPISARAMDVTLNPGAEARYRIVFPTSSGAGLGDFTISEGDGRTFKYDLRGVK